jgi:hypothetical protein
MIRGHEMKHVLKATSKKSIWVLLVLFLLCSVGCEPSTESYSTNFVIKPMSNQSIIDLSADDIVRLMQQVGFSDEQIAKHGANMRDSLLCSGAAQLEIGDKVEAIFAVNSDCVYIATRLRGSFIYDSQTREVLRSHKL